MHKHQRTTLGLVAGSVGITALAFVPGLSLAAAVWWTLGLAGLTTAVVLNVRPEHRRIRTGMLSGVAFVAAGAAAIALVGLVAPSSAHAAGAPRPAASSGAAQVVELASELRQVSASDAARLIGAAERQHYEPRSGLDPDWAAAKAFEHQGATVVSVPLIGTDVPEMTKLSFVTADDTTSVTEMVTGLVTDSVVHFAM